MNENNIAVGIADIKVTTAPGTLTTNLGSCIGVCLYDKVSKAGGMLHLMMAAAGDAQAKEGFKVAKYADTGIPALIQELQRKCNVSKTSLSAKIFGGAKILKTVSKDIGTENIQAVKNVLKEHNISILASKVGGEKGYKIVFDTNTGKVKCQIFGQAEEEF